MLLPVLPISIGDKESDGTAYSESIANPRDNLSFILLYLHAKTTAIALLAAFEFLIDIFRSQRKASHHSFDYGYQSLTVGFSSGGKTKLTH
jgi:hypothetical protein